MVLNGTEVLYLDETTFIDRAKNVKGGIPILFPNSGTVWDNPPSSLGHSGSRGLGKHGFARMSSEWISQTNGTRFTQMLVADEQTRVLFPFEFVLSVSGATEPNGSCTIMQRADNLTPDRAMPTTMGLHPYFKVPCGAKKDIRFEFAGGVALEDSCERWSNGTSVSIPNPKLFHPGAVIAATIPELGVLVLDVSVEYSGIWVWSLPGKDFVCIEPVMRDGEKASRDPVFVAPNHMHVGRVNISLHQ